MDFSLTQENATKNKKIANLELLKSAQMADSSRNLDFKTILSNFCVFSTILASYISKLDDFGDLKFYQVTVLN